MRFQMNKKNQPKNKHYFTHVEARAIREQRDLFLKNPENMENKHVDLGFYTIDLKLNVVFETNDPANVREYYSF